MWSCISFGFNLEKISSETYEIPKKPLRIMPRVEHKPLIGIPVSKVAELCLKVLNLQMTHHQGRLMKVWKKCISSMRTGSIRLTKFVTFQAYLYGKCWCILPEDWNMNFCKIFAPCAEWHLETKPSFCSAGPARSGCKAQPSPLWLLCVFKDKNQLRLVDIVEIPDEIQALLDSIMKMEFQRWF